MQKSSGPLNVYEICGVDPTFQQPTGAPANALGADFKRYEKTEKLGEGTYGVVYKAKDRLKDTMVALKKVRMEAWEDGVPATALREISVLKEIRHQNIVTLEDVFVSYSGNLYLVFELLDRDLKQFLDAGCRGRGLPSVLVKSFLYQLLSGINECHEHRIIHRDIKPQNVLLHRTGDLKLADFGLARTFSVPLRVYTHEVVTLWYRCPEILMGSQVYSTAVDVWSAGCIFAEMASGMPLFAGDSEIDQVFRIFERLGTPTPAQWSAFSRLPEYQASFPQFRPKPWSNIAPNLDERGRDLLSQMLNLDPMARISARDAMSHPYFQDLRVPPFTISSNHAGGGLHVLDAHPGADPFAAATNNAFVMG